MALLFHTEQLHQGVRGRYIGDFVYGANDGIVTTFAVVAGAAGATFAPGVIIVLGLANLIGDGISMGLSNFLAIRSRQDFQHKERRREIREVKDFPEIEKKEVRDILIRWKLPEQRIDECVEAIVKDEKNWVDLMMREELGIVEEQFGSPLKHGAITFLAFLVAGSMPMIPYLFGIPPHLQFPVSLIATAVSLFTVGSLRTLVTGMPWIRSGMEMLGVGSLASFAAYAMGSFVKIFFGISA